LTPQHVEPDQVESESVQRALDRHAALAARLLAAAAAALALFSGAAISGGAWGFAVLVLGASLTAATLAVRLDAGWIPESRGTADRRARITSTLLGVSRDVQAGVDGRELARRAARAVTHLLGADSAIYFALDAEQRHAVPLAGYGVPVALRDPDYRIAISDLPAVFRDAGRQRQAIARADVIDDPDFDYPAVRSLPLQPRSVLVAPATRGESIRGALVVCWWREAHEAADDEIEVATAIANHVGLVVDAGRAGPVDLRVVAVVAPNKTLFIVARHNEHLYQSLLRTFAGDETVEVVLDRRLGERRPQETEADATGRIRERRRLAEVDAQLRRRGWAVVTVKPLFP
jgi:GAF domain-containing protein